MRQNIEQTAGLLEGQRKDADKVSINEQCGEQYLDMLKSSLQDQEIAMQRMQRDMELLQLRNQELTVNTMYAVNNLINICNELQCQKAFKLIHLIRRIRHQFFKGTREERKRFWRWLISRFKKRPDADNRFKPLNEVITQLLEIQRRLLADGCISASVTEALPGSVTGIPAECLTQIYDKPDIIIFSVINYDFRFQRPQHFANRFAENGHIVF